MTRKLIVTGALTLALSGIGAAPALAEPNPNPAAPEHTGTACTAVLTNNPQTGDGAHLSPEGLANLAAVGAAMCGL